MRKNYFYQTLSCIVSLFFILSVLSCDGPSYEEPSLVPIAPVLTKINNSQFSVSGGVPPYSVTSSNTSVATASISDDYIVTVSFLKKGSATITVTGSDNGKATMSVTVN